jgi:DNA primase
MWRSVNDPILCLDGDAAGQRAALRAAERALTILKPGKSLRFASLPVPEDPDSLIQKSGATAMQLVCDQAIPLADMLWRAKFQPLPLTTPEQRAGVEQEIKAVLAVIPDPGLRRDYIFDFIGRLRQATRANRPQTPWLGRGRAVAVKPKARIFAARDAAGAVTVTGRRPSPLPPPAAATQEKLLLLLLLEKPWLIDEVAESLGELQFADSLLDKLRQDVLIHAHSYGRLDRDTVWNHLQSRGFSLQLDCLLEATAHELVAIRKAGSSQDETRGQWHHIYGRYRQKELAVDFERAQGRMAADLTDENVNFVNALWSGRDSGGNSGNDL